MRVLNIILLFTLLFIYKISAVRLAIFNDIHLNITYDLPCGFPSCNNLGKYNFNSPAALVEAILDDLQ